MPTKRLSVIRAADGANKRRRRAGGGYFLFDSRLDFGNQVGIACGLDHICLADQLGVLFAECGFRVGRDQLRVVNPRHLLLGSC